MSRNHIERTAVVQAVREEVGIEGEDVTDAETLGEDYERRIREVHWSVGVFIHQGLDCRNSVGCRLVNNKRSVVNWRPQHVLRAKSTRCTAQIHRLRKRLPSCNHWQRNRSTSHEHPTMLVVFYAAQGK